MLLEHGRVGRHSSQYIPHVVQSLRGLVDGNFPDVFSDRYGNFAASENAVDNVSGMLVSLDGIESDQTSMFFIDGCLGFDDS